MPQFTTRRRVRHSAADMFDLVADVERYPEFVPLCKALKVRQRTAQGEGVEIDRRRHDGSLTSSSARPSRSRVTLDRPKLQILVEYLQARSATCENRWTFSPAGEQACEVEFFIDYEFRSRMLGLLMGGDVRRGVPPLRRGVRGARRPGLRRSGKPRRHRRARGV